MPPRLIRLTERVPRVVRLRRADADYVLARHRGRGPRPPRLARRPGGGRRVVRRRRAAADSVPPRPRGPVEVAPAGPPGRYRLTALGFAGVIAAPSCRLALRPKLPAANVVRL